MYNGIRRSIAIFLMTAGGALAQTVQLPDNVPPWAGAAAQIGRADGSQHLLVSVYLKLRNEAGLQKFVQDVYSRGNAQYRRFLTPQEFRAAYAPAAADVAAVKDFLSRNSLKFEYAPDNSMYVAVSGTVAQVERAFAVTENLYNYRGKKLRANAQAPSIPSALSSVVAFIGGLDQSEQLIRPHINTGNPKAAPGYGYATPDPCSTYWSDHTATLSPAAPQYGSTFPWVVCGYTPAQIRAAYGVNTVSRTGAGVRVGIVDAFASPTIVDDVNAFSAHYGLPLLNSSNFQQVVVPGTFNYPENFLDPADWYGEQSLDIEWVHAMAPGAKIVYAGAQNSWQPLDHALIHLIDSGLADIITNSWGIFGDAVPFGHLQADERAFMQAAAQGISVLFSSGDDGDVAAYTGLAMGSWPATSPYVTAVGGTSLGVQNPAGAKVEWGWGTYTSTVKDAALQNGGTLVTGSAFDPWPPEFFYGSGGGISLRFLQPSYQQGVVPQLLATSTVDSKGNVVPLPPARRVVPDISMVGDPNTGVLYGQTYDVSGDPDIDAGCTQLPRRREYCERRIGGTSLSSPLFAGVLALVNESRASQGKGSIGFVNPALYQLPVGNTNASAPIIDVRAPSSPTALLRRNQEDPGTYSVVFRTVNSVPVNNTVVEGADTSLRTTNGWDNVTGLGTPYVPLLITGLTAQ
jgi:subtilase family serine protease